MGPAPLSASAKTMRKFKFAVQTSERHSDVFAIPYFLRWLAPPLAAIIHRMRYSA